MTFQSPESDVRAAEDMIRRTKVVFSKLFPALEGLTERAETGDDTVFKDMQTLNRELVRALNNLNESEAKLDALCRKDAGIVYDFALDLEEARSEIGRRLDCIAERGGAQSFSGQPE